MRLIPDLSKLSGRAVVPKPRPEPQVAVVEPVEAAVPGGLKVASEVAWRSVVVIAGLAVVVYALQMTSSVVIPVAFAMLLTSLLEPLVRLMHGRWRMPRYLSGGIALIIGLAVFLGIIAFAGAQLVTGVAAVASQASSALNQIQGWLTNGPLHLGSAEVNDLIDRGQSWLSGNAGSLTSGALAVGSTATSFIAGLVIALVVTFFFLGDGPNIWGWTVRMLPRASRKPVHNAARRGWTTLGSYVRTQILVAGIDALGIGLGAFFLGLPLVVPLALIVFVTSFIPMVGAFVSGALVVLVALVSNGLTTALIMLLIVLLVQQLEGNVLQPVLMSRSVSLHPLATLLGVAVGSFLIGIVGALFAVPLMAFANVFVLFLRGHDKFPEMGQADVPLASYEMNLADGGGASAEANWTDPAKLREIQTETPPPAVDDKAIGTAEVEGTATMAPLERTDRDT